MLIHEQIKQSNGDKLQAGIWKPALDGDAITVADGGTLKTSVAAHDVQVYLLDARATQPDLVAELTRLMEERGHPTY